MSEETVEEAGKLFGLMAEFDSVAAIKEAAARSRAAGYTLADAFTPFPVEGLSEDLGYHRSKVPFFVLMGGLAGALGGFFMQYFANVIHYPWNIGGRPPYSWPAFIPITFECAILLAALSGVGAMIMLNGLPQPYHPVFNVPQFQLASRDRFFLLIPVADPKFDLDQARTFLASLNPLSLAEVPA